MSGSAANLITAKGLVTFSNELSVPEGSLVKATNVNIDESGVISPRRGLNDYGTSFGISTDRLSQLMEYKDILIRHYNSILEFDDGSGVFTAFSGTYDEIEDGFRLKYKEANSNFYFTSSDGIKKISATSASGITSSSIENSGAIKAYDVSGSSVASVSGFLTTESKVAYRVVFGTRDNNNNLLLGTPSSRLVVTNTSAVSNANVDLSITLTTGLTTDYFYQVYRTGVVQISGALTLDDIDPGDEMNLVDEAPITSSDLSAGTISVSDITPEDFREGGTFLYTNEITGEGILQSNDPPPIAKDISLFRSSMFYANTKTLHQLSFDFISVANFTAGTTEVIIGNSTTARRYVFDVAEDVPNQQALLSASPSVGQAIDETARSFVKVINRDPSGTVFARYLSGSGDLPGKIFLESRSLTDDPFYIATNDSSAAADFNPILPIIDTIVDVTFSAGSNSPAKIQATGHGLSTGTEIYLYSPDTTPAFSGKYSITVLDANNFTVPVDITGEDNAGTNAFYFQPINTTSSDNLVAENRVYFSKTGQPEAVPSVNYIDVGPKDEVIERILALRDNLFILKTDGVYIVDGVTSPNFSVRLLDNSANIVAPDSAVVLNNQIYCLSNQGVISISETGVSIISRRIENRILSITNSRYNFRLPSFGVSYESDRSYILWMPTITSDTVGTQAYRYNTFERTWTRWDKPATCGVVSSGDDKLYTGDGTRNYMLQERKNDNRTDHADRNFTLSIGSNKVNGSVIELSSVSDVKVGDVLVQEQYITLAIYNRLLKKLDLDPGLDDVDYESSLIMSSGDNITLKLNELNTKLVADDASGTITSVSYSTDWTTLRTEFNALIDELNDNNCDTQLKDYKKEEDNTYPYEAVIISIENGSNNVTVNYDTNFIQGDVELYVGIEKEIQWSPQHFGNPSILKQVREGTVIFDQNNFYSAEVSYSSDLSAGFVDIPFLGKGVGFWGDSLWGNTSPDLYWGGNGNDIPLRVHIPRAKQRGRYLNVKFKHNNAREVFRILGISAIVRPLSSRAYR